MTTKKIRPAKKMGRNPFDAEATARPRKSNPILDGADRKESPRRGAWGEFAENAVVEVLSEGYLVAQRVKQRLQRLRGELRGR